MFRVALTILLCSGALSIGVLTACLAARNRSRSNELDEVQRWCETFSRSNELFGARLASEEWQLLSGGAEALQSASVPEVQD